MDVPVKAKILPTKAAPITRGKRILNKIISLWLKLKAENSLPKLAIKSCHVIKAAPKLALTKTLNNTAKMSRNKIFLLRLFNVYFFKLLVY